MRIGLCSLFRASHGGGETHLSLLSKELIKAGHEICRFNAFDNHPNAHNNGIVKTLFGFSRKPLIEDVIYDAEIFYHKLRLHRFIMENKIDLIHFHYVNFIPTAKFLRTVDRIPVVASLHWCPLDYPPELKNKLWHSKIFPAHQYNAFTFGIKNANIVISPSNYYANLVEQKCGVSAVVIPNALSLDVFARFPTRASARKILCFNSTEFVIICVGRLDHEKGLKYLINAFKDVVHHEPSTKLIIIGDGPLKNKLMHLAYTLGLNNVLFVGRVSDYHLSLFLSAADLYVSPSVYETFGISVLEAIASGLPIVSTNVGGLPELVEHGKNGLLVPPRNSVAMSESIINLIVNESKRKLFIHNNREKAKLYSVDVIFPKLLKIYSDLL